MSGTCDSVCLSVSASTHNIVIIVFSRILNAKTNVLQYLLLDNRERAVKLTARLRSESDRKTIHLVHIDAQLMTECLMCNMLHRKVGWRR